MNIKQTLHIYTHFIKTQIDQVIKSLCFPCKVDMITFTQPGELSWRLLVLSKVNVHVRYCRDFVLPGVKQFQKEIEQIVHIREC